MTLFRKVFQNQGRPATTLEEPDTDALREALTDTTSGPSPLVLDPFDRIHDSASEDFAETFEDDETVENSLDDADTSEVDAALAASAEVDDVVEESTLEMPEVDLDALAEKISRDDVIADTVDTVEAVEDVVAAQEVAVRDEDAAPEEKSQETISNDAREAEGEKSMSQSDVVAFAQQQLQALGGEESTPKPQVVASAPLDLSGGVEALAASPSGRRAGRVKTRLLGFNRPEADANDPFVSTPDATATAQREKFPVGWLVVVEGPGVGHSFSIFTGASMIGRGEDQMIKLDFGDNSISRQNHAAIAYDEEQNKFYIGHGGKSNIIRRNARPVLSTEELIHADLIRIGETTLRFVALCGSDFKWDTADDSNAAAV